MVAVQTSMKGEQALPGWMIYILKNVIPEGEFTYELTSLQDCLASPVLEPATKEKAESRAFSPFNEWEVSRSVRFIVLWATCYYTDELKIEKEGPSARDVEDSYNTLLGEKNSKLLKAAVMRVAAEYEETMKTIPILAEKVCKLRDIVFSPSSSMKEHIEL